jgi:two-component system nitrogen regulation response regulator GlnG
MLGQAPAMQDVFSGHWPLESNSVTVMITGESGSGKSWSPALAQTFHTLRQAVCGYQHGGHSQRFAGVGLFGHEQALYRRANHATRPV